MRRCLNWKVVVALAAVAALVLLLVPRAGGIIPFLAVAACPLSMVVMMWSMRGSPTSQRIAPGPEGSDARVAALEAQIAALQADRDVERNRDPAQTR